MSSAGDFDLAAIQRRIAERAVWCEEEEGGVVCGQPATEQCAAGNDCGVVKCAKHAVPFSHGCDHRWRPLDDGAEADLQAALREIQRLRAGPAVQAEVGPAADNVEGYTVVRNLDLARLRAHLTERGMLASLRELGLRGMDFHPDPASLVILREVLGGPDKPDAHG